MAKAKRGRRKWMGKDLRLSVSWLERLRGIKKVILAQYKPYHHNCPSGYLVIKNNTESGFRLRGFAGDGFRDIFIVLDDLDFRDEIKQAIEKRFPTN